jgi:predicted Na+-dependent transporter
MLGLIRTALPTALIALMFAQGLLTVPGELLAFFRSRPWLILRSLAAVLVLVPAAGLAIFCSHPRRPSASDWRCSPRRQPRRSN